MTSKLCSREIFEAGRQEMGFSPARDLEETEKASIYQLCVNAAEKQWGSDFLSHLDDLIVFHRLSEATLPLILDRLLLELNQQLSGRQISCSLDPAAVGFIVERAARQLRHGGWLLGKVFRRFVLFPVADLVSSGRLQPGSLVRVVLEEADRLRFQVEPPARSAESQPATAGATFRVPVLWDDTHAK
jgi:ATP-dependent Clp protease ATP-binding subunit ClpA